MRVLLVLLGIVTMTPGSALVDVGTLGYYGVEPDPGMETAMLQHRGMLQVVLGGAIVWAAYRPSVRVPVAIGAIVTKGTALLLAFTNSAARSDQPLFSTVFDSVCIGVFGVIVATSVRQRGRRTPAYWRHG